MEVSTQGSSAHGARLLRGTQHTHTATAGAAGSSSSCRTLGSSAGGRQRGGWSCGPRGGEVRGLEEAMNCLSLGGQHEPRWSRPWTALGGWRAPPIQPPHRLVVERLLCRKRPRQVFCPGRPAPPQIELLGTGGGAVPVLGQWQNAPLPAEAPCLLSSCSLQGEGAQSLLHPRLLSRGHSPSSKLKIRAQSSGVSLFRPPPPAALGTSASAGPGSAGCSPGAPSPHCWLGQTPVCAPSPAWVLLPAASASHPWSPPPS